MDELALRAPTGPALYSARIVQAYLELIAERYPAVSADALLERAGLPRHEAADTGHWLTQDQVDRFHEAVVAATGRPDVAHEAGLFAPTSRSFGRFRQWAVGQLGLTRAYVLAGRANARLTRASTLAARPLGPGAVELVATPHAGVRERPFQCRNRTGILAGLARIFLIDAEVTHPECQFTGAPHCRYVVRWRPPAHERWQAPLLLATAGALAASAAAALLEHPTLALGGLLTACALQSLLQRLRTRALRAVFLDLGRDADRTLDAVRDDYEDTLLVRDLGRVVSRQTDPTLVTPPGDPADPPPLPTTRDLASLLADTLHVLGPSLDLHRGLLLLPDVNGRHLVPAAHHGFAPDLARTLDALSVPLDAPHDPIARAFAIRAIVHVERPTDPAAPAPPEAERLSAFGATAALACPLAVEQHLLGVLYLDRTHRGRPTLQRDLLLVSGLAPAIAVALHSAGLAAQKDEAERAASTDALTALPNRRGLEAHLAARWATGASRPSLAVLMLDIDRFKDVNDRHGHAVGDAVLGELAALLRALFRDRDLAGRWGGEEFLVLLDTSDPAGARRAAERARSAVAEHAFAALGGAPMTVSIGGALASARDADAAALVARADAAMYEAKRAGRDRVVIACGAPPAASAAGAPSAR